MGIKSTADSVFRDFVTDGVQASGLREPPKVEIRQLFALVETAIGNAGLGALVDVAYATRAELDADLDHDADSVALTYADATDANNDFSIKVGASGAGSWTLTTILHDVIAAAAAPQIALAADEADRAEDEADRAEEAADALTVVINPQIVTLHFGVLTLGEGEADFPAGYSWLRFQAPAKGLIREIGLDVATVGSGAVKVSILTGDPDTGNMTFVRSTTLTAVAATGDNTWADPDAVDVEAGQWVALDFPAGGVGPRRRNTGAARGFFRTPPLTVGAGAYTAGGIDIEAYVKFEVTEHAIERSALSPEVRGLLSSVEAAGSEELVWTGYGGEMTTVAGVLSANGMAHLGTAPYSAPLENLLFRVPTLNNGKTRLAVVRGALNGTLSNSPLVIYDEELPVIGSAGAVAFSAAGSDFGPVMLEEGDHVYVTSSFGGPTLGMGTVSSSYTTYYSASGSGSVGMRLTFTAVAGLTGQGRFSQRVRNLRQPVPAAPLMWDIFVITGQSNGKGQSEGGGPVIQPGIAKQYYSGALTEILGDPVGGATYGSLGPAFVNEYYRRTGRGVILVPAALDGSPLLQATLGGTDNWSSTGTLRGTAMTLRDAAQAAATAANLPWQYCGVIWVQGERDADAIDAAVAGVSGANYIIEFGLLNAYWGGVPILIVQTGHKNTGDTAGYVAIRGAQKTLARTHANVFLAHTGAYRFTARGLMKDLYHYEQPAYDEMGVSLAMVAAARCVGSA